MGERLRYMGNPTHTRALSEHVPGVFFLNLTKPFKGGLFLSHFSSTETGPEQLSCLSQGHIWEGQGFGAGVHSPVLREDKQPPKYPGWFFQGWCSRIYFATVAG